MSGLAAAVAFDHDPSIVSTLRAMLDAAPHRGPDGSAVWHDTCAALGLLRHDVCDCSPVAPVSDGRLTIVFDGRLDNRGELIARLSLGGAAVLDDGALALRTFGALGDRAVEAIEGDFAFVVWNAAERRALIGRDRLGLRPLYWTRSPAGVLVASDVAQLVRALGCIPPADESAIADLLGGEPPADQRTFFRGIARVPPGCTVTVDAGRAHMRPYWTPSPMPLDGSRTDDDLAEECRSIVDASIHARLRARARAAVFFSGGIDSSVVLMRAAAINREWGRPGPVPVSLAFDEPETDERVYRDAVAGTLKTHVVTVRPDVPAVCVLEAQARQRLMLPDLPADYAGRALARAAAAHGASVVLTGSGADLLFTGSPLRFADGLAQGHVVAAVRQFSRDVRIGASGTTPRMFFSAGLWPLVPARHRARLRRIARRVARVDKRRDWLRLPRRATPIVPDPPPGVSNASWEIAWSLKSGWTAHFLESAERIASEFGIDERHPLLDPALVDFALRIPENQRYRDGTIKWVLRRAVPELPALVGTRTSKADFGHVVASALAMLGGRRLFADLRIAEAGWIDPAPLLARYDRLERLTARDDSVGDDIPMLWMVAATELWFRAAYGNEGVSAT